MKECRVLKERIIQALRAGKGDAGRIVGKSLKVMRELVGLSQNEIAQRLNLEEEAISKIEDCEDIQLSLLQVYVEAFGAKLQINTIFPASSEFANRLRNASIRTTFNGEQLVLPILSDNLYSPQRNIVLSIHPKYCKKIIEGRKTVELRRRFPASASCGTIAYIYSTSPVCAMVGRTEISNVIKIPIHRIWQEYADCASVTKKNFDTYFEGLEEGYALEFANAQPLPRQLALNELRERFSFKPPQSFLYLNPILQKALQDEYSNLSTRHKHTDTARR